VNKINKKESLKVEKMNKRMGNQTVVFEHPPVILGTGTVAGKKEGEGPIGQYFDVIADDNVLGAKTWEKAESDMIEKTVTKLIKKSGVPEKEIGLSHCHIFFLIVFCRNKVKNSRGTLHGK
jgi:hypothetical protein